MVRPIDKTPSGSPLREHSDAAAEKGLYNKADLMRFKAGAADQYVRSGMPSEIQIPAKPAPRLFELSKKTSAFAKAPIDKLAAQFGSFGMNEYVDAHGKTIKANSRVGLPADAAYDAIKL